MNHKELYVLKFVTKHELFQGTFTLELTPSKESLTADSLNSHGPVFDLKAEVKTMSSLSNPDAAVKNIKVDIFVSDSLDLTK